VPRTSLPQAADRVIGRLVDAGLLVSKDGTIELAHERLIDDRPKLPLKTWLAHDATDRHLIDQLRQRVDDITLPDGLLAQAEDLMQRDRELAIEEPALGRLVQRSRDERRARERRRLVFLVSVVVVALGIAMLAGYAWVTRKEAQVERDQARAELLAIQARRADREATSPDDIELAGALALASIAKSHEAASPPEADAIEVARSTLVRLPRSVLSLGSGVGLMKVLPDGRLAALVGDGKMSIWPKDGAGEPEVRSLGSGVSSFVVLPDGRLVSADFGGKVKLWSADGADEHVVHSQAHGGVLSMAVMPDGRLASAGDDGKVELWSEDGAGELKVWSHSSSPVLRLAVLLDGRLASGGDDGKIKLWPKDGVGDPEVHAHSQGRGGVSSLVALPDGRLASGGDDGKIKLWPKDGVGDPEVHAHSQGRGGVSSLVALPDGRLASGGDDGKIRLWSNEGTGVPVVLTHRGKVRSLAVLPDGRLASGGDDGKIKLWPKDGSGEPTVLAHEAANHNFARTYLIPRCLSSNHRNGWRT
jgi:hypothetical protein